jgi:zinc protease
VSGLVYRALDPAPVRRELANGLRVIILERHHLPTASAILLLPAGTASEPAASPGIAFFTSQLLTMGSTRYTATELADEIDGLGAAIGSGCDHDYVSVEVSGLARTAEKLLDVLAEVVLRPGLRAEDVERRRSQILGILERRKDDYDDLVRNRFAEMVFGDHPYHRVREGTSESIQAIGLDEISAHHAARYGPTGAILALVGDLDAEVAYRWVEERFSDWSVDTARLPESAEAPTRIAREAASIQEEVTQAHIRIGNAAFPRNHPDYAASVVANYILGGAGFGSRLMRSLREEKGLTYGAYSIFRLGKQTGHFSALTHTGLETMNAAIRLMLSVIEGFVAGGVTEDELVWAKKFLTGSLPLTLETNDQIAQKLLEQEFYGLAEEFWIKDLEEIQAIDVDQVGAVARRQIRPESFTIVVLADFRENPLDRSLITNR